METYQIVLELIQWGVIALLALRSFPAPKPEPLPRTPRGRVYTLTVGKKATDFVDLMAARSAREAALRGSTPGTVVTLSRGAAVLSKRRAP